MIEVRLAKGEKYYQEQYASFEELQKAKPGAEYRRWYTIENLEIGEPLEIFASIESRQTDVTVTFGRPLDTPPNPRSPHVALMDCKDEGLRISGTQFRLEHRDGNWTLFGARPNVLQSFTQVWGHGAYPRRIDKYTGTFINPGDKVCGYAETPTAFYWILITRPRTRSKDSYEGTARSALSLHRETTNPIQFENYNPHPNTLDKVRVGVGYKFGDFLSWPLHPHPIDRALTGKSITLESRGEAFTLEQFNNTLKSFAQNLHAVTENPRRSPADLGFEFLNELAEQLAHELFSARESANRTNAGHETDSQAVLHHFWLIPPKFVNREIEVD